MSLGTASPTVVLVHLGSAPLPHCLKEVVLATRRLSQTLPIVVIADEGHADALAGIAAACSFVPAESLADGPALKRFRESSALPHEFRHGFWFHTSARFLVLAEFMRRSGVEDVIHLENDVALFFDPVAKLDAFRQFAEFAVPLDRNRAIPGIVWCANPGTATRLEQHMIAQTDCNDMVSLGRFCAAQPEVARPLPTLPRGYAAGKMLDLHRYSEGIEQFGGIFDAAAIGQYIGGVHWLNNPHDSRFFLNESSDLDLRDFDVAWDARDGVRCLTLTANAERTPVLSIHAHSKDIAGISPFNHGIARDANDIVTTGRVAALADLTLDIAQQRTPASRDGPNAVLEIPANAAGQTLVPDAEFIERCRSAKVIAIPAEQLPYFERYVAPRLTEPFSLIVPDSRGEVGLGQLGLLDHPLLVRCWTPAPALAHPRLAALPSGIADGNGEGAGRLCAMARRLTKEKMLYVGAAAVRANARIGAAVANGLDMTVGAESDRLAELARHRFCLCPLDDDDAVCGFWEAQYLDCVPVVLRSEWRAGLAELPVLLLNSWDDLPAIDWQRNYIRITCTAHRFDRLSLAALRTAIAPPPPAAHPIREPA